MDDGKQERPIVRLYYGGAVVMTIDATKTPFFILEPLLCDLQQDGCRIEIKKVIFPCSGTPRIEDEAWLLASADQEDEEVVTT